MRVSELVSDLTELRSALATELESVNRYEPLIDTLAHEEARSVMRQMAADGKRHIAALSAAIEALDPKQAEAGRSARDAS